MAEGKTWSGDDVSNIITNPIYAGLGPYPAIVTDEQWVAAASRLIREEGAEVFLTKMLTNLRQSLAQQPDNITSG